jgi:hypothetical protein
LGHPDKRRQGALNHSILAKHFAAQQIGDQNIGEKIRSIVEDRASNIPGYSLLKSSAQSAAIRGKSELPQPIRHPPARRLSFVGDRFD